MKLLHTVDWCNWPKLLDVAEILQKTLNEEKETDELLTSIAENSANVDAEEEN
jgi:ferritin-like metal-binding protein YciE